MCVEKIKELEYELFDDEWRTIETLMEGGGVIVVSQLPDQVYQLGEDVMAGQTPKREWKLPSNMVVGKCVLTVATEDTDIPGTWIVVEQLVVVGRNFQEELAFIPWDAERLGARINIDDTDWVNSEELLAEVGGENFMKSGGLRRQRGRKRQINRQVTGDVSIWMLSVRDKIFARDGNPDLKWRATVEETIIEKGGDPGLDIWAVLGTKTMAEDGRQESVLVLHQGDSENFLPEETHSGETFTDLGEIPFD